MITVTKISVDQYCVKMGIPERHIVLQISAAFSISGADAVVAIVNRGMDSISKQVAKTEANKDFGKLTPDADHGGD